MSRKPKHHDLGLKRTINDIIDKVEKDEKLFDVSLERLTQGVSEKVGRPVTCASCTEPGCCSQLAFVTFYEALPIARYLRMKGPVTDEFIAKLRALGERQESMGKGPWFDLAQPCVFLNNKRCTIYSVRPMCCRQHLVWSEAKLCQPPSSDDANIIFADTKAIQYEVIGQSGSLLQALGLAGEGVLFLGSLPRMVAIVLEAMKKPKLEEFLLHVLNQPYPTVNAYAKWLNGKNPFAKKEEEPCPVEESTEPTKSSSPVASTATSPEESTS